MQFMNLGKCFKELSSSVIKLSDGSISMNGNITQMEDLNGETIILIEHFIGKKGHFRISFPRRNAQWHGGFWGSDYIDDALRAAKIPLDIIDQVVILLDQFEDYLDEEERLREARIAEEKRKVEEERLRIEAEAWAKVCAPYPKYQIEWDPITKAWVMVSVPKIWPKTIRTVSGWGYRARVFERPITTEEMAKETAELKSLIEERLLIKNDPNSGGKTVFCSCGEVFFIEPDHMNWFKDKELTPFTRCEKCREKKKRGS